MILGLSHIGLTVSDLGLSLKFYQGRLGLQVLSDAERKGEVIDRATGLRCRGHRPFACLLPGRIRFGNSLELRTNEGSSGSDQIHC